MNETEALRLVRECRTAVRFVVQGGFRIRVTNPEVIGMTETQRIVAGIQGDRPAYDVVDATGAVVRTVWESEVGQRDVCQNTLRWAVER